MNNGPTVQAWPVTCYGNKVGWFPAGISINLDCNAVFVANETVNPAVGSGSKCGGATEAGGVWTSGAPMGVATVDTVKLNTEDGFVWIAPADYTGLITHCNECCKS